MTTVARVEVSTAVKIEVVFFWVIAPCCAVVAYQHFGRLCTIQYVSQRVYVQ